MRSMTSVHRTVFLSMNFSICLKMTTQCVMRLLWLNLVGFLALAWKQVLLLVQFVQA